VVCCHRRGNSALAALLGVVLTDAVAAEITVVALAPGLRAVARRLDRYTCDPEETSARVVFAAWAAIHDMVGASAPWPASAIVDRVRDAVRVEGRADRRWSQRIRPTGPTLDVAAGDEDLLCDAGDGLGDAVRGG
jgi:hypothetical protein